jgi:heme A synthase
MDAPLFSIVSLVTELFVTAGVFYIIYYAYYEGHFMRPLAYGVLAYEMLVNISYMSARLFGHVLSGEHAEEHHEPYEVAVAIFHGVFSLTMFIALIVFFIFALRAYGRGENFFKKYTKLTITFVAAWVVSVFSGVFLFFLLYAHHLS